MSDPRLPPEISDHIVDLLHDQPETLKRCCLVSRSWVQRTRKHLFGEIVFPYLTELRAWKNAFPDPDNSPAKYTRSVSFGSTEALIVVVEGRDYWTRVFHHVVGLTFLRVFSLSHPDIPTFLCSLPNLKDLTVTDFAGMNSNDNIAFQPATLPPLAGTLTVVRYARLERLVTQWLGLPNSIHFRKFKFLWETGPHVRWVMPLVEACSDTLEHIDLEPQVGKPADALTASIDFSKATKLTSVVLRVGEKSVLWATMSLKTITSKHRGLRKVTIHIDFRTIPLLVDNPINAEQIVGKESYMEWMDLDRVLVELRKLDAVCVGVSYRPAGEQNEIPEYVEALLPETAKGGSAWPEWIAPT